jgi:hypothetical protein
MIGDPFRFYQAQPPVSVPASDSHYFIPKEVVYSKRNNKAFDWSKLLNDKYGIGIGSLKNYIGVDDPAFIENPGAYTPSDLNNAALKSLKDLDKYDNKVSPVFVNDSYHFNQSVPYASGKLINPVLARKALYKSSPEYVERLAFDYFWNESHNNKRLRNKIEKEWEEKNSGEYFPGFRTEIFRQNPQFREFLAKKYLDKEGVRDRLIYERNQPIEYNAMSKNNIEDKTTSDENWDPIYTNVRMFAEPFGKRFLFPSSVLPHEHNHFSNLWLGRYLKPDYEKARGVFNEKYPAAFKKNDEKAYEEYAQAINELQGKVDLYAPNIGFLQTFHQDDIKTNYEPGREFQEYIYSWPVSDRNRWYYRPDYYNEKEAELMPDHNVGYAKGNDIRGDRIPLSPMSAYYSPEGKLGYVPSLNENYLGSSTIGTQNPPGGDYASFNFDNEGRVYMGRNLWVPEPTEFQFRNYYESTEESMADIAALRDYLFKSYNYDYTNPNSEFTKDLYKKIKKDKRIREDIVLRRNLDRIGTEDEDFYKWKILMEMLASNPSQNIGIPMRNRGFFPSSTDYRSS